MSSTFIEASVCLPWPSSGLRFANSFRFRFVLESCLFVSRLRFCRGVFFCAFVFSVFLSVSVTIFGGSFGFAFLRFSRVEVFGVVGVCFVLLCVSCVV